MSEDLYVLVRDLPEYEARNWAMRVAPEHHLNVGEGMADGPFTELWFPQGGPWPDTRRWRMRWPNSSVEKRCTTFQDLVHTHGALSLQRVLRRTCSGVIHLSLSLERPSHQFLWL